MLDCYPSFHFCFGFGESRQLPGAGSSLRSVAGLEDVLDESCGGDVEDELVPELDDNPRQQEVRSSPFCIVLSSLVWSGVAFDRWPTHEYVHVLRRAFQGIELQACHRAFCTVTKRSRS